MRTKVIMMKKPTMRLAGVGCSFALSACGGGSAETPTTMLKQLDYVACDKPNPVSVEVALIAKAGINPVKRSCNRLAGVIEPAYVPSNCDNWGYFAHSVLDVRSSEVAKAKSIGYSEQLLAPQIRDPANDFACD